MYGNSIKPIVRLLDSQRVISFLIVGLKDWIWGYWFGRAVCFCCFREKFIENAIISKGSKLTAYKEVLNYIV
jgi:hypothetical protein